MLAVCEVAGAVTSDLLGFGVAAPPNSAYCRVIGLKTAWLAARTRDWHPWVGQTYRRTASKELSLR